MCLPVRGPNPLFEHATSSLRIMQPQPHSFSCLFLPYKICPSRHQLSTVFSFSSGFHGLCRKKDVNSGTVNGDKGGTSSDCLNIQKTDFFLSEGKYKLPQQKCRFLQKTTQSALFLFFMKNAYSSYYYDLALISWPGFHEKEHPSHLSLIENTPSSTIQEKLYCIQIANP